LAEKVDQKIQPNIYVLFHLYNTNSLNKTAAEPESLTVTTRQGVRVGFVINYNHLNIPIFIAAERP